MSREKSPAFQFYPRDFLTDEHVRSMSSAARGVYVTLLSVCWLEGSIPESETLLVKLAESSTREWRKVGPSVLACFYVGEDGRYHHKRLDLERTKQAGFSAIQSNKGKRSAEQRFSRGSTAVQPEVNSSSASASASTSPSGEGVLDLDLAPPPDKPSKHPLAELWNSTTTAPIPKCREVTPARAKRIKSRLKERDLLAWMAVFQRIEASTFCRGENDRQWCASFDWILKSPDNAVKVLEGVFDNRPNKVAAPNRTVAQPMPTYDPDWCQHDPKCQSRDWHDMLMEQPT